MSWMKRTEPQMFPSPGDGIYPAGETRIQGTCGWEFAGRRDSINGRRCDNRTGGKRHAGHRRRRVDDFAFNSTV